MVQNCVLWTKGQIVLVMKYEILGRECEFCTIYMFWGLKCFRRYSLVKPVKQNEILTIFVNFLNGHIFLTLIAALKL